MQLSVLVTIYFAIFALCSGVLKAQPPNHGYPYVPQKFQWAAQIDQVMSRNICNRLLLQSKDSEFRDPKVIFSSYVRDDVIAGEKFALDEMVRRKVITHAQAKFYLQSSIEIEPERLTYVAVSYFRTKPAFYVGDASGPMTGVYTPPSRVSFLRMVSGHKTDGTEKPLPWMLEPELAALASMVNRTQSPRKYIYEWGRAADVERRGMIRENVAMMSYIAARDVVLNGGRIDQAEIHIHSTTEANTENYRRNYKFVLLGKTDPKFGAHAILTKPLAEILREFHPWNYFPLLAKVMALKEASPDAAIALHEKLKHYRLSALDVVDKKSEKIDGLVWLSDHTVIAKNVGKKLVDELVVLGASEKQALALLEEARPSSAQEVKTNRDYVLVVTDGENIKPEAWIPAVAARYSEALSPPDQAKTIFIVEAIDAVAQKALAKLGFVKHDAEHYSIEAKKLFTLKTRESTSKVEGNQTWETYRRHNL